MARITRSIAVLLAGALSLYGISALGQAPSDLGSGLQLQLELGGGSSSTKELANLGAFGQIVGSTSNGPAALRLGYSPVKGPEFAYTLGISTGQEGSVSLSGTKMASFECDVGLTPGITGKLFPGWEIFGARIFVSGGIGVKFNIGCKSTNAAGPLFASAKVSTMAMDGSAGVGACPNPKFCFGVGPHKDFTKTVVTMPGGLKSSLNQDTVWGIRFEIMP